MSTTLQYSGQDLLYGGDTLTYGGVAVVPANKWSLGNFVPRNCMIAWHMAGDGSAGNLVEDFSGNGRNLSCGAGNSPVLQTNLLNGQPGWYFNGSRDPLVNATAATVRHLFIVASHEDAAFNEFRGLYGGVASGDILVSESTADEFFDFTSVQAYNYRKSDVAFAASAAKSPMSGLHSVIEVSSSAGFGLDGIQIGKQKGFATRLWKGWFFEAIAFDCVLPEVARVSIYEYFAMKYFLWKKTAAGLNIFPFAANRTSGSDTDRESYRSEPYEGDPKALVRGNFRSAYTLPYLLRRQEEFVAARAFHAQHSPIAPFIFRDYRHYPAVDTEVEFTSGIREQGSDVTYRFNYSFDVTESA